MPGKHHLRGFKIAKKIGSPLRGSWTMLRIGHRLCIVKRHARKTSLTGVQIAKKKSARRYAARGRCSASSLGQTPPWKKARSAPAPPPPRLRRDSTHDQRYPGLEGEPALFRSAVKDSKKTYFTKTRLIIVPLVMVIIIFSKFTMIVSSV